jgi:hopanoid biosynthesis associated protein HpnK
MNPEPSETREEPAARAISGGPATAPRRLIVNADDFGRSHSINLAVAQAHDGGVLTTASLMVNEEGFEEAVALSRQRPRLGVGLHLALICGHSALAPEEIAGLVDPQRRFSDNPVAVGFRYYLNRKLVPQLQAEIEAQFKKFQATGLRLDHVNGHLHLHLHPVVFRILRARAKEWGLTHLRLTCEPFWMNTRLARGRWLYRIGHALIHRRLSAEARGELKRLGIKHTQRVFGLLQDSRVDEEYVLKLLRALPPGDSELYSHPSLDQFRHEFDALVSPRVKALVQSLGIPLIRYQDL